MRFWWRMSFCGSIDIDELLQVNNAPPSTMVTPTDGILNR